MARHQLPPRQLEELEATVVHDLRSLRDADLDRAIDFEDGEPARPAVLADEGLLRDASVRMRRLVEEGTLQRYRKAIGRKGEPHMRYFPLDIAPSTQFAQSAGATKGGASVMGLQIHQGVMSAEEVRQRFERQKATLDGVDVRLSEWRSSVCMVVAGTRVTRSQVIKYVANKLGGVHLDPRRSPDKDSAYLALDRARSVGSLGLEAPYIELLSIIQQFMASTEVAALLPPT